MKMQARTDSLSAFKCKIQMPLSARFRTPSSIVRYASALCMIYSGAVVYWDVEDYIKEAKKQLNDKKNYKTFQDSQEPHKKKKIFKVLII